MKGRPSVGRRTQRLEELQQQAAVFDQAQQLAAVLGITAEDLMAEAVGLRRRMAAIGAITRDHQLAFLAAESGIPEHELRAELGWIGASP